jgi:hypothetical protein
MGKKCSRCGGSGQLPATEMVKQPDGTWKQIKTSRPCPYC